MPSALLATARLDVGVTISIGGEPIGIVVGFEDGNPVLAMDGQVFEVPRDAIDVRLPDVGEFPVGTKVDSSKIRLFRHLNRGTVTAVHPDGMLMVRWDREGECLQRPSELRRTLTIWDHLKR